MFHLFIRSFIKRCGRMENVHSLPKWNYLKNIRRDRIDMKLIIYHLFHVDCERWEGYFFSFRLISSFSFVILWFAVVWRAGFKTYVYIYKYISQINDVNDLVPSFAKRAEFMAFNSKRTKSVAHRIARINIWFLVWILRNIWSSYSNHFHFPRLNCDNWTV